MKRSKPLKRTPLRRVSAKRRKELKEYAEAKRKYLSDLASEQCLPEGDAPYCECCGEREATDIHHKLARGKGGAFLDPENFLALCRSCHSWVHANPSEARKQDLLI